MNNLKSAMESLSKTKQDPFHPKGSLPQRKGRPSLQEEEPFHQA